MEGEEESPPNDTKNHARGSVTSDIDPTSIPRILPRGLIVMHLLMHPSIIAHRHGRARLRVITFPKNH
jgi:hypothetical protein